MEIGQNQSLGTIVEDIAVGPSNIRGGISYTRNIQITKTGRNPVPPQASYLPLIIDLLEAVHNLHADFLEFKAQSIPSLKEPEPDLKSILEAALDTQTDIQEDILVQRLSSLEVTYNLLSNLVANNTIQSLNDLSSKSLTARADILAQLSETERTLTKRINELQDVINNSWYKRLWRWIANLFKGTE